MIPASIKDIPQIIELLRLSVSPEDMVGMELAIASRMRVPGFAYILSDNGSMLHIIEPLGSNGKGQSHLYTDKTSGLKLTVKFVKKTLKWIFENSTYTTFLGFTPEENKGGVMLTRLLKFTVVGTIVTDSGVKENITMVNKTDFMEGL